MTVDSDEEANHGLFSPGGDYSRHPVNIGIGIFLLTLTVCVSYPLFIYAWMQFKRNYNDYYFQQRGVRLILLQTIIMFAHNCILSPIKLLYDDLALFSLPPELGEIIEHTVDGTLLLALALMLTIRVWLVNYNYQLQMEMANAAWKQQLNAHSHSTSFYAQHRNTFGSLSWLSKIVGAVYMCCILVMTVLDFISFGGESLSRVADTVILVVAYTICIVLTTVIWFKFPKFNDNLFIRYELKVSIVFIVSTFLFGALLVLIGYLVKPAYNISTLALMLAIDGLCYLMVLKVIKLNTLKSMEDALANLAESIQEDQRRYTEVFSLQTIVADPRGYTEFMNFLVKEFASESLCFATEYAQFRESLNLSDEQMRELGCNMEFSTAYGAKSKNSQSEMEQDNLECEQIIETATKLYHKYIASGSATYEINVSYRARLALAVLLDAEYREHAREMDNADDTNTNSVVHLPRDDRNKLIEVLIPIMEQILQEMLRLLLTTFTRYQMSDEYMEMCRELMKDDTSKQDQADHQEIAMARAALAAHTHSTSHLLDGSGEARSSSPDGGQRFTEMSVQSASRSNDQENMS